MRVLRQSWAWFANDPGRRVIAAALLLILGQLGFRAWAVYGGWFQLDDFTFMSRLAQGPLTLDMLLEGHAGHWMPLGMLLSWFNLQAGALEWVYPATELLVMQALASVGILVLLVSAFGRRLGILPPLAIYLFTVISLPAFIWWAAGVNQLPFQIAIGWAGWTHLNYLRSRRVAWLLATWALSTTALLFYEKTLLLYGLFAFIALAYFAKGDLVARLKQVASRYWLAILAHSLVIAIYLPFYVELALNWDPDRTNEEPLGPVFFNVVGVSYTTGIVGGPLEWEHPTEIFSLPSPTQVLNLVAGALLILVLYEITRSRTRSKRAWILPALFLGPSVLLLAGGRTSFVGPALALDYRYQTELAAVTALALGLALFPLRGAVESADASRRSNFLDLPVRVGVATLAVAALGTYSSTTYALHWQSGDEARRYFKALEADLTQRDEPVRLVDAAVPEPVVGALAFPYNQASKALHMFDAETVYPQYSTDELHIVADDGTIQPVVIEALRRNVSSDRSCPYPAKGSSVSVPLDAPVTGSGWWVRVAYASDRDTTLEVEAGDQRYTPGGKQGLHNLFLKASGHFQEVAFSEIDPKAQFCITEIELGLPRPAMEGNASESGS